MSTQPTSGPWIIATSNSWRRIMSQRGDTVCEPIRQPDGHPDLYFPNGGANGPDAHVLAAAQDMYEALETVVNAARDLNGGPDMTGYAALRDAIVTARAALSKAGRKS